MNTIVKVQNITKDYGKGDVVVHALRGINLHIKSGDFSSMAGPSGSGKSTLLNIIGGLDRPTSGKVIVEGKATSEMSMTGLSRLRRDRIGFIFQNYSLIPVLTAIENAEYILMLQGIPSEKRKEKVMDLLKQVGLEGMENRFPRELSGGQQQRVAIARAIASEPALVLADEPTANVDSRTAAGIMDLMERLNSENKVTFLFSTHDREVMRRARRLIWLRDGKISED